MQKSIIRKQLQEKLKQLQVQLGQFDPEAAHTHADVTALQKQLQDFLRSVTIYEYLLAQSEIAPDLNVHFKIMEETGKKEVSEEKPKEEKKNTPTPPEPEKVIASGPEKKIEPSTEEKPKTIADNVKPSFKKLEISINDRFRMINELFHQNQNEFNIVVEQLNTVQTPEEAQVYIAGLVSVYNWDEEKDIVKTLRRLALKRFA